MTSVGSSVPRRELGRYLKQAREEAGWPLETAAKQLEWSRARMYRIEGGQTSVRTHDVELMCRLYGTSDEIRQVLVGLAGESKARGWWQAYGDAIPDWFELYVGMEAAADRLRQYEPALVPGLLQTREYAERVLRSKPGIEPAEVAQAVSVRLERQQLLTRGVPRAPKLDVVLGEAVLRQRAPEMPAQLQHLVDTTMREGVTIRVVPIVTAPHHVSLAGGFVIVDFPTRGTRPAEPTTVYSESLTGALYLEKAREVAAYAEAWVALDGVALDPIRSADLIKQALKEHQ
ncbi:helix-turn-helix domain-containing protein [Salinispora pacifica]|uniref:helix-turn-helix domain-containing protein n=1 Tax=Salinispora pacifica TaxID=351187 RepID=UPI0009B76564|nr:helix-turn-helix transcriptional regulator [Salinispora pacifica]